MGELGFLRGRSGGKYGWARGGACADWAEGTRKWVSAGLAREVVVDGGLVQYFKVLNLVEFEARQCAAPAAARPAAHQRAACARDRSRHAASSEQQRAAAAPAG